MADDNIQQQQEETVILKKSEYEQIQTNKYAEGGRKGREKMLEELGVKSVDELKLKLNDPEVAKKLARLAELEDAHIKVSEELSVLKSKDAAIKAGATKDNVDLVIALVRGQGKELNDENLKAAVAVFAGSKSFGTQPGGTKQDQEKKPIPKIF